MTIDSKLPVNITLNDKKYLLDWKDDHYYLRSLFVNECENDTKLTHNNPCLPASKYILHKKTFAQKETTIVGSESSSESTTESSSESISESSSEPDIKFHYQIPDYLPNHIRDFFNESKLPVPSHATYVQCQIDSAFIPDNSLTILIGYTEKYRKYFYPVIFHLDSCSYYLTGQPIYYNYNQIPSIDIESFQIPVLKIKYRFDYNSSENNDEMINTNDLQSADECYNLIRIFTLNPPIELYQIIT